MITNRLNLPQPIVDAVANDDYTKGDADISVTSLLSPPRKVALEHLHQNEISEDASERIWSLLGQAIHTILERAATTGIAERRLSITVEGWSVSGGMDYYAPEGSGLLQDYKCVTVWKFKNGEVPMEYEQQLNMYAQILRENGHKVSRIQIVGILRDWSKLEAQRDPNYPQTQIVVRDVTLWPEAQAKAFIRERVILHQKARQELPECTAMERWQKPDTFAVMRLGAKRSIRNYTSEEDAIRHADEGPDLIIQKRSGESTRCKHYCSVSKFCTQFKEAEVKSPEPLASTG